jgi:DNA-binding beta-propeller fold protein YncE
LSSGLVIDANDNIYVSENRTNRVLFFLAGETKPTRVYGQAASFETEEENKGGVSGDSLACPTGLALDKHGNLYVSDAKTAGCFSFLQARRRQREFGGRIA